ncbi:MAG: hypothetical protein B6245_07065 [Desulfobacteraceae bacterium 4572_88]|nr:MAG: hypothetical protein B6245_07065 [Desulfobacteraceae bacterium 4572_88]
MKQIVAKHGGKFRAAFILFLLTMVYGFFIEPEWIVVRHVELSPNPRYRLVHISDIHYKGGEAYFNRITDKIKTLSPDFVCITGDIVDDARYLGEVLRLLEKIPYPVFGVPGNHEYLSNVSFDEISRAFRKTGGEWLTNERVYFGGDRLEIVGAAISEYRFLFDDDSVSPPETFRTGREKNPGRFSHKNFEQATGNRVVGKRILLAHYPAFGAGVAPGNFDIILSGHSHGGQIRLPIIGALILPPEVGEYDRGLFKTDAGPLYVNPGIGTYAIHARLFCRPEITVIAF